MCMRPSQELFISEVDPEVLLPSGLLAAWGDFLWWWEREFIGGFLCCNYLSSEPALSTSGFFGRFPSMVTPGMLWHPGAGGSCKHPRGTWPSCSMNLLRFLPSKGWISQLFYQCSPCWQPLLWDAACGLLLVRARKLAGGITAAFYRQRWSC